MHRCILTGKFLFQNISNICR